MELPPRPAKPADRPSTRPVPGGKVFFFAQAQLLEKAQYDAAVGFDQAKADFDQLVAQYIEALRIPGFQGIQIQTQILIQEAAASDRMAIFGKAIEAYGAEIQKLPWTSVAGKTPVELVGERNRLLEEITYLTKPARVGLLQQATKADAANRRLARIKAIDAHLKALTK